MAQQVSFHIRAIDGTRAAFASVNQGLNRLVRGGDMAQRRMLGLGLRMTGIGSIAMLLGSQVRKVAQDIESVPGVSRETIDSWDLLRGAVKAINDTLGSVVAGAGHAIASLGRLAEFGWNVLVDGLDEAQRKVLESDRALAILRDQGDIEARIAAMQKLGKARRDLANIGETDGASITRRRQEADMLEQQAAGISDATKQMLKQTEAVEVRTAAERDYQKLLAEHTKLTTAAGHANAGMFGATLSLKERIEGLSAAWARTSTELAQYNDLVSPASLEARNKLLAEQKVIADQLTKAYDEQNRIAADAARTISGSFENAVFAGENLRGTIRGIGQDLMRYIFQKMITERLGGFLTGGIGKVLGLASGGPVSASSPYIVGEAGPELFVPSQAGRIIPNHSLAGSSPAAAGNTYIIDARGTDESVVSRLSSALMQLAGPGVVERRAIAATTDRRARGASFA